MGGCSREVFEMPTRNRLMPTSFHSATRLPTGPPVPPPAPPSREGASGARGRRQSVHNWDELWEGPTLRELVEHVEHQFGQTPALAGVFTLGFGRDEPLTPGDVQAVCDHLGLPATDFGLDP